MERKLCLLNPSEQFKEKKAMQLEEEHKCSGLQAGRPDGRSKFNVSSKRTGRRCQAPQGREFPVFLTSLLTREHADAFHGNGWQNESVKGTRSPFSKYNSQAGKSGLLLMLVLLPEKLLLIPQDPAQMSPPLGGPPRLTQVDPRAPLLCS